MQKNLQVHRVEEKDEVFSLEVSQLQLFHLAINYCRPFKVWSRF